MPPYMFYLLNYLFIYGEDGHRSGARGGERATCGSQFSPPTMWVFESSWVLGLGGTCPYPLRYLTL